ncbi:HNH endonuclease signature motif containing protein [Nocardia asiatica]|uniref:HNH endonuclease signature motif containing protein n=1 Tax=Nocardia asiatica TaxID=209252 RepID=UPI002453E73A|nr:HNH endonuclease signature motif containing protein [Nocardia asiatica]
MPGLSDPLLIKKLFGRATRCAYPACHEELIFEDRGKLTPNVEIAHIRSKKPKGPRYDPAYPKLLLDTEENLLLLCRKHHTPVDHHTSVYQTDEVLEWKHQQIAGRSGRDLSDSQVAQIIAYLQQLTQVVLDAEVVAVAYIDHRPLSVPLEALADFPVPHSDRYLGVTVTNSGLVPATIVAAGIDWEIDFTAFPARHLFDDRAVNPYLAAKSSSTWRIPLMAVAAGVAELASEHGVLPKRFRPFAKSACDEHLEGAWRSILDMPFWKADMSEDRLNDMAAMAAARRNR